MTASSKSITLPSALTLTLGGALFIIKNTGFNKFPVRNSAGALLSVILPGQIAGFYLSNNATAAGVWAVGNQSGSALEGIFAGAILSVNSINSNWVAVTSLSATQAIIAYKGTTGYLQACTLNVSGTTLTAGAVITANSTDASYTSITKLSTTQAMVVFAFGTQGAAQTLNVSGTTVTAGAQISFSGVASTYLSVSALSATQAVVVYIGTSSHVEGCVLSVSGTTTTVGTVLTINATSSAFTSVSALSATQAIIAYAGQGGLEARTVNVSGTTLTTGAILVVNSASSGHISVAALSATQAVVVYNTNFLLAQILNVSGTTVTAGEVVTVHPATSSKTSVAMLSATRAIVSYTGTIGGGQSVQSRILNISGNAVSANDAVVIESQALNATSVTVLSASLALVGYAGVSNFVKAALLEPAL